MADAPQERVPKYGPPVLGTVSVPFNIPNLRIQVGFDSDHEMSEPKYSAAFQGHSLARSKLTELHDSLEELDDEFREKMVTEKPDRSHWRAARPKPPPLPPLKPNQKSRDATPEDVEKKKEKAPETPQGVEAEPEDVPPTVPPGGEQETAIIGPDDVTTPEAPEVVEKETEIRSSKAEDKVTVPLSQVKDPEAVDPEAVIPGETTTTENQVTDEEDGGP